MKIFRLMDIDKRPIKILKSTRHESKMGPYLAMEDDKGRLILSGGSQFMIEYDGIPTPFYIT